MELKALKQFKEVTFPAAKDGHMIQFSSQLNSTNFRINTMDIC
jgi:hypothetical protein